MLSTLTLPWPSIAAPPLLAVSGLEVAGVAGYAALVLLVLRLAVGWAERSVSAEGSGPVVSRGAAGAPSSLAASGDRSSSSTPSARG